ncbi:MAG: hypothetical protein ACRDT5_23110 [Mycobacterium sp.]
MTTAIVLMLILLGVGIVVDQLLRLRKWLQNAPPDSEAQEPPDGNT